MVGHGLIGIKLRRENKEYIYTRDLNVNLDIKSQLIKKLSSQNKLFHILRWHAKNYNHMSYCAIVTVIKK